jgi:hypothetical protein
MYGRRPMAIVRDWMIALAGIPRTIPPASRKRLQVAIRVLRDYSIRGADYVVRGAPVGRERLQAAIRRLCEYSVVGADYIVRGAAAGTRNVLRKDEFDPITVQEVVFVVCVILCAALVGLGIPWLLSRR